MIMEFQSKTLTDLHSNISTNNFGNTEGLQMTSLETAVLGIQIKQVESDRSLKKKVNGFTTEIVSLKSKNESPIYEISCLEGRSCRLAS